MFTLRNSKKGYLRFFISLSLFISQLIAEFEKAKRYKKRKPIERFDLLAGELKRIKPEFIQKKRLEKPYNALLEKVENFKLQYNLG